MLLLRNVCNAINVKKNVAKQVLSCCTCYESTELKGNVNVYKFTALSAMLQNNES